MTACRRRVARALTLGAFLAATCCDGGAEDHRPQGELGVFYGGEVQRLQELVVDPVNAPNFGFRLQFPEREAPPNTAWDVRWEVVRPGPLGRRIKQVDRTEVPRERDRLDQLIAIAPEDPVGTYNVRVTVDDQLVIDRAVVVRGR